ncbi:hypothetical protein [Chitinophaga alhagiae]|uniref:hypothetical protein n=1 Tax=Chitinophaga alhagiae TaxID=2203219 RepID=UPI000E5BFCA8|nr:hypothetical protein [Chitinophaga alhagiae]
MEQLKTRNYGCTELNATEAKDINGGALPGMPGLPDLSGLLNGIPIVGGLLSGLVGTVTNLLGSLLGGVLPRL